MPGNIAGPLATTPGLAGWSWYTGSAAWNMRAIIEALLGLAARPDGLHLQAALPDGWDHYHIQRWYRGATYQITVRRARPDETPHGTVNGQAWEGTRLPIGAAGSVNHVEVIL